MGPPLQYHHPTFTQAAKDICRAAWEISEVAATLHVHQEAASTPEIKSALAAALNGCKTELYKVHGETERVSWSVKTAAGVIWSQDYRFGQMVIDGDDYDTRHYLHPFGFAPPGSPPLITPYSKLPGE